MRYHAYELAHAYISPMRFGVQALHSMAESPLNPFSYTPVGKALSAGCEVFENITRRYGKPDFNIDTMKVGGRTCAVSEHNVLEKPFCRLKYFKRDLQRPGRKDDPTVLIVAPMSGHYATLLRGTVQAMLPDHEVYITDWIDARQVPLSQGNFDLDDFIDYVIEFVDFLGPDTHIIGVCQPSVPVLAAVALMAKRGDPCQPASMTLMGGPIDTRRNPTVVNKLAEEKPIEWFESQVISSVPFPNPGYMRRVYPGFMQLTGFMTMNLDRHVNAHWDLFSNLVKGDQDSVTKHQEFYEEYLAVMDLTAEFFLQTVKTNFQDYALANGTMTHRGELVDCSAIKNTALFTVEGELDDISGLGQTEAAQDLCTSLPKSMRAHYVQNGVGHYGVFNGRRWREQIQPRIAAMIRAVEDGKAITAAAPSTAAGGKPAKAAAKKTPAAKKPAAKSARKAPAKRKAVSAKGPAKAPAKKAVARKTARKAPANRKAGAT